MIKKTKKLELKYDYLEKNGVLYRNMSYKLKYLGSTNDDNRDLFCYEVDFTLPNGSVVILTSETIKSETYYNQPQTGQIDVLIDPNNYNNYYIDFNIIER